MVEVKLLVGSPTVRRDPVGAAARRVETAIRDFWAAHDSFIGAPVEDYALTFALADARKAAVCEVDSARLDLRTEIAKSEGRRLLRAVGGEQ